MEYFKSGLKSVLGTQDPSQQLTGAETVERLVERVESSTLLEDRRDACRALKALSKKYRVEVGAQGMEALKMVLEADKQDCEIVGYALDALCNIMSPYVNEEEECPEVGQDALLHIGEQFTEMFLKHTENVTLVLSFLEEYDFRVRWPALKLLSTLLTNRLRDIQEIILVSPMGVSKLMDMLSDSREIIRNDTLLLLIQLTKGNANIQKIVAFENAFDRLFDVIHDEGWSDGGVVVEDCLLLMCNLLKNNTSNQNFFKEGSYIQRLCPMFELPEGNEEKIWPPQKVTILRTVLEVVRCLVSPSNPGQVTSTCQKALFVSGIFQALISILMASGVPDAFLTDAIVTLSEVIRGNQHNQQHFSSVLAPSTPPREAIVILLMSMVNEKQPFVLRSSVLYCFECYLYQNEIGQAYLVQTLLPSSAEVTKVTCGQLLCSGMFSHDALSNWLSAVALSHALIENPAQREQLLRVLLAPDPKSSPVTLLQQVSLLLQQSCKVQSKIGFLILLATWLAHCQLAVKHFLELPTAIPYLTAQAGSNERDDNEELVQGLCAFLIGICILFNDGSVSPYNKDSLLHLVSKRVGVETFLSKLGEVSRHEHYSKASKQPHPRADNPSELLLDYEFCKLFKALESMVIKVVCPNKMNSPGDITENNLVSEYKDVIRDQDKKLADLQERYETAVREKTALHQRFAQIEQDMARLVDENALLRAQVNSGTVGVGSDIMLEIERWKVECNRKDDTIQNLESELRRLRLNPSQQQVVLQEVNNDESKIQELQAEIERLTSDQDDLLELLADRETKLSSYKERLRQLGQWIEDDETEGETSEKFTA